MRAHYSDANPAFCLSILTQFFPPDYAATGQLIEELAKDFSQQGVSVQIFTGQPGYAYDRQSAPSQEISHGITICRTRTSRLWPRRIRGRAVGGLIYCLRALIKLLNPTFRGQLLLVTTEPPYLPILAYVLSRLLNQPYICVVYDLYPEVAVALNVVSNNHWLVRFWRWLNRCTWQHAEAIITLSPTMTNQILSVCPEAEGRISVIHNWANPNLIFPRPKEKNWFAIEHGLNHVFTVLYSGNMGRCHDMDTILAAASLLLDEPVRFVFIGAGVQREPCQARVRTEGISNCLFLPYQPKETLPFSLTACDLSLVSLRAEVEGLVAPSKLYSSLAAGRPIAAICEPHSYLRSLLQEGKCGQAFNNGDGVGLAQFVRRLAANPEIAKAMGRRGRAYMMQHFTPKTSGRQYVEIMQDCLRNKSVDSPTYANKPEPISNP